MSDYEISIDREFFSNFLTDEKTKKHTRLTKARILLNSEWMVPIQTAISQHENRVINLSVVGTMLYNESKRADYLTIKGSCKDCGIGYSIVIPKKPEVLEIQLRLVVNRKIEHDEEKHLEKMKQPQQIRGDARTVLAQDALLTAAGSSKRYHDTLVAEEYERTLNDEGQHSRGVPTKEVINKCIQEFLSKEINSTSWILNVMEQARISNIYARGKIVQSYLIV
jgi:hypothetical protein